MPQNNNKVRKPSSSSRRKVASPSSHAVVTFNAYPGIPRAPRAAPGNTFIYQPSQRRVTLRYCEPIAITTGAGTMGHYAFCANGVYDPNITGTGHQPMGFDNFSAEYNSCTVVSSRARFSLYPGLVPTVACLSLAPASSVIYTNTGAYIESGMANYTLLDPDDTETQVMSRSFNAGQFFSVTNAVDEDNLTCIGSANPSEGAFFHFNVQDLNRTSITTIQALVVIDYDCVFHSPKYIPES